MTIVSFLFASQLHAAFPQALARLSNGQPDTLEIHAIKVSFPFEETDNSLTTGRGTFDSDGDTASSNYSLDPQGSRGSTRYWEQKIAFARAYFAAASRGKLHIEARFFPTSQASYQLDKSIIDYNRTARRKDEKVAEFDEARARDYMQFIQDAIRKAHAGTDPVFAKGPASPNRFRAYLIIHAGASRLVDGGSLGTLGADTPGDFLDIFVDQAAWQYTENDTAGIVFSEAGTDTIREVMVVSETGSQDGLNWGINGILVNQIGRQIGMPSTYDVVKGISRLGAFDVMDFAGYNAGSGFLPVLPNPWLRAYMGWSTIREVRPTPGISVQVDVHAALSNAGDEIIKIPLQSNEYLLVENRQRTNSTDGTVAIETDRGVVRIPIDSLHLLFQDSVCNDQGSDCRVNPRKAKGVILGADSYDAALPGSGLAVWHVNEWVLRESLRYGAVNFWAGDTFRDHQFGMALMESDGVLSIGKEFKNSLGQPAYDYGSGSDLLPHKQYGKGQPDTVFSIAPRGYANTQTTTGGFTGIRLTTQVPAGARVERSANAFLGDSVLNWAAPIIPLTIEFESSHIPGSQWPVLTPSIASPWGLVPVQISGKLEHALVHASIDGTLQLRDARGAPLVAMNDSFVVNESYDSVRTLLETVPSLRNAVQSPLYSVSASPGLLLGMAARDSLVFSLHKGKGLWRTALHTIADSIVWTRDSLAFPSALLGPMLRSSQDETIWVADSTYLRLANVTSSPWQWIDSLPWPTNFTPMQIANCGDQDNDGVLDLAAVGEHGHIVTVNTTALTMQLLNGTGQMDTASSTQWRLACSDFNRDGSPDAFVLGNHGHSWILDVISNKLLSPPRVHRRGRDLQGLATPENGGIALGDLDGDGYPEAVFAGFNSLIAIDSSNVPKKGWPVRIQRGLPETGLQGSPLLVDVDGDSLPDALAGTPNGLSVAFDSKGKSLGGSWPLATGTIEYGTTVFPQYLTALSADSLPGFELYSTHRNQVSGYRITTENKPILGKVVWGMEGGSPTRSNWLPPATLVDPIVATSTNTIKDFYIFPNPVRDGKATAHFELGRAAQRATLRLFDITGLEVYQLAIPTPGLGSNRADLDLSHLGRDIYSARLEVQFSQGTRRLAWDRLGILGGTP